MSTAASAASYQLQTVSRALDALRLLERAATPLSQTEIAGALDEPVPVVFRILHTLESRGFVSRRPGDKRYVPTAARPPDGADVALDVLRLLAGAPTAGVRPIELADRLEVRTEQVEEALAALARRQLASATESGGWLPGLGLLELARPLLRNSLRMAVRPLMERLRDESGESAALFVTSGNRQVVIDIAVSRQPLRYEVELGRSFDLHRGAAGKVALAAMAHDEIEAVIAAAALSAEERRMLLAELRRIRERGYATSTGERLEGAAAVAAVVRDASGRARGALSLMMPAFRNPPDRLRHLGKVLVSQLTQLRLPDEFAASAQPVREEKP